MPRHKPRARNLDDRVIEQIVQILDGWTGKLSWDLYIKAISARLRATYTRQALSNHTRIKEAFAERKKALAGREQVSFENKSPELQLALERIQRLEAENERIKRENNTLLMQFVRWAYNASTRKLDVDFLNQPIPGVNRDKSEERK